MVVEEMVDEMVEEEMVVEEMVVAASEVGVQGAVETALGGMVREEGVAMARGRLGVERARAVLAAAVAAVRAWVVEEIVVEEMVVEEMVVAASEVGVQGGALRRCRQFH